MQPRTTAILLVVALALGAFVYLYEIEGEDARNVADEASRRIFSEVEADAIERLALTTGDGVEVTAIRGEGGWRIATPVDFPRR